jgi:hypothetical protein
MPQFTRLDPPDIVLTGADVEPTEEWWLFLSPRQRETYYLQLAVAMRDGLYRQLHKGIGANGQRLRGRKGPRHDRATGPVLVPHWSDSRFRTQLRWEATGRMARLYWLDPWASIVSYHARGLVRGAPVRNVIGLCAAELERAVKQARKWYAGQDWATPGAMVAMAPAARQAVTGAVAGFERTRVALGLPPLPSVPWLTRPIELRAPLPPARVAPPLPVGLDAAEVAQRVRVVYDAAGRAATTDAAIRQTMRRLERYRLGTLREVAVRLGIDPAPDDRDAVLELIRRTLVDRLREARRLYGIAV